MRIRHYASEELSSDLVTTGEGWDRQCEIGFYYGPDLQRVVQTKRKGQMFTKVLYLDGVEIREVRQGGYNAPATLIEREERSGFSNGVKVRRWTAANPEVPVVAYEFAVKDHLGSDNGVYDGSGRLQNQRGVLEAGGRVRPEQQSYDAWGARRDGESWAPARGPLGRAVATAQRREGSNVPRGYTGHEALDDVGLVHMNGRLYDPALGRMCSPDPVVVDAEDAASYNGYSYVGNNPLGATDPTGYVGETATQLTMIVVEGYRDNWLDRIMDSVWAARNGAMLLQKQQARQYAASMNYVTEAQVRALVLARQMASSQTVMNGVRVQGPLGGLGENVSPQYAINGGEFSLVLRQSSVEAGAAPGEVPEVPLGVEEADGAYSAAFFHLFNSEGQQVLEVAGETAHTVYQGLARFGDALNPFGDPALNAGVYDETLGGGVYSDIASVTHPIAIGGKLGLGRKISQGWNKLKAFAWTSKAAKTVAPVSDDVVRLYHQGSLRGGQVSSTRGLSTSPTPDLGHYRPGGQLYEFQVPRSTYNQWLDDGLAVPKTDLHLPTGIVTPEIRVMPPASGSLNQYLVRPPGG